MAFAFKRKESVRHGLERLARDRIEHALRSLEEDDLPEAVHEARRGIKQVRALLRLARAGVRRSDRHEFAQRLREASRRFRAARDAWVRPQVVSRLSDRYPQALPPGSVPETARCLNERCRQELDSLSQAKAPREVRSVLKQVARDFASLKLKATGWRALGPGLKRSYRQGRTGFNRARDTGQPEDFHQWRKRVKDLLYHTGLLCKIKPRQMARQEARLDELAQLLGDDHDLVTLAEFPGNALSLGLRKEAELMDRCILSWQHELRSKALKLGQSIYADRPSEFCARMAGYWEKWRC